MGTIPPTARPPRPTAPAVRDAAIAPATVGNAVATLVVGASLVVQVWLVLIGSVDVNSGASTASNPLPVRLGNTFSYFTIQSNALVLVGAIRLLVDPNLSRGGRGAIWWQVVRLDGLLGIVITGIVYVLVLRPLMDPTGIHAAVNAGLHYVAPPLALACWLLFGPRPRISRQVVALALIWPVAWIVGTLIRGALTDWYPYPFLNVAVLGAGRALLNIAVVLIVGVLIIAALAALDRLPVVGGRAGPAGPLSRR